MWNSHKGAPWLILAARHCLAIAFRARQGHHQVYHNAFFPRWIWRILHCQWHGCWCPADARARASGAMILTSSSQNIAVSAADGWFFFFQCVRKCVLYVQVAVVRHSMALISRAEKARDPRTNGSQDFSKIHCRRLWPLPEVHWSGRLGIPSVSCLGKCLNKMFGRWLFEIHVLEWYICTSRFKWQWCLFLVSSCALNTITVVLDCRVTYLSTMSGYKFYLKQSKMAEITICQLKNSPYVVLDRVLDAPSNARYSINYCFIA